MYQFRKVAIPWNNCEMYRFQEGLKKLVRNGMITKKMDVEHDSKKGPILCNRFAIVNVNIVLVSILV